MFVGPQGSCGNYAAGHGQAQARALVAPKYRTRAADLDQGIEMLRHALTTGTGIPVHFCEPRSPWQRGCNQNTKGLLRRYLPRGSDLTLHTAAGLGAIADELKPTSTGARMEDTIRGPERPRCVGRLEPPPTPGRSGHRFSCWRV